MHGRMVSLSNNLPLWLSSNEKRAVGVSLDPATRKEC